MGWRCRPRRSRWRREGLAVRRASRAHELLAGPELRENQSQPVCSSARGWEDHSRSSQAVPVTGTLSLGEAEGALDGEEGHGVVVAGLALGGLSRVALVALQDDGALGGQRHVVAEVGALGGEAWRRPTVAREGPFVEQASKGSRVTPAWPVPPRARRSATWWALGRGDGGVGHPELGLGRAAGGEGGAEERPLQAVGGAVRGGEVGGDVPPFDAEQVVGAVVLGEGEGRGGSGRAKPVASVASPAKP
jgi:hypothetical protein